MNLLQVFIAVLCLLNPIGGINLYSTLVANETYSSQIKILAACFLCISCSLILLAAIIQPLLILLSFPLYAIHFGGGILLVIIGMLNMLKLPEKKPLVDKLISVEATIAVESNKVPSLGIWSGINPLSFASLSPAVIIVDINYSFMAQNSSDKLGLILILLLVSLIFCCLLLSARWIKITFSPNSLLFITRLIGLIITAVAFQMIIAGATSVLPLVLGNSFGLLQSN